ncbi:MAG TPA: cyclic nucleotide-binding domain-containing protein [Jiangellaceae bacterium]
MNALANLLLGKHPWLAGLMPAQIEKISEHAHEVKLAAGQVIFSEGEYADRLWLIWEGQIAIVLDVPGRGTMLLETLDPGDSVGWSWLFPPYRWRFSAVATTDVRAVEIDGPAIRALCDDDPVLCAAIYRRVSAVAVERLQATRLRLLDMYAAPSVSGPDGGA